MGQHSHQHRTYLVFLDIFSFHFTTKINVVHAISCSFTATKSPVAMQLFRCCPNWALSSARRRKKCVGVLSLILSISTYLRRVAKPYRLDIRPSTDPFAFNNDIIFYFFCDGCEVWAISSWRRMKQIKRAEDIWRIAFISIRRERGVEWKIRIDEHQSSYFWRRLYLWLRRVHTPQTTNNHTEITFCQRSSGWIELY